MTDLSETDFPVDETTPDLPGEPTEPPPTPADPVDDTQEE